MSEPLNKGERNGYILKYLFYLVLIIVIYLVGRGIYEGNIDKQTTVGEVVDQVESGSKQMMQDTGDAVENAIDDYKNAPKREINVGTGAASAQ